jgi:ribosomal protein S27AE
MEYYELSITQEEWDFINQPVTSKRHGIKHTEESKIYMSKVQKELWANGRIMPEHVKQAMAEGRGNHPKRVRPKSEAQKEKLRKPKPEYAKELYRQSALNREKVNCPHCGKLADISNAKRWHFDNCKSIQKD